MTWRGYYAPAAEWLEATAVTVGDRLHVTFRGATGTRAGGHPGRGRRRRRRPCDEADSSRLRFLAEVSEVMIGSLDTAGVRRRLMDLVVPRLCDWATVTVLGYDGQPADLGRAHGDPGGWPTWTPTCSSGTRRAGDDSLMTAALLTGEPVHLDTIDPALVEAALPSDEVRDGVAAAGPRLLHDRAAAGPGRDVRRPVDGQLRRRGRRTTRWTSPRRSRWPAAPRSRWTTPGSTGGSCRSPRPCSAACSPRRRSPTTCEIAVRYQPAGTNMHVGGDWYDAFQQRDGATLLVIGDVVGHNVDAAAAMGQIRSIVRGIAYDRQESPAQILGRVDEVLTGLRIGTLATALVARIEQPADQAREGLRTLRWSSAGHLPPVLLHPDGHGRGARRREPEILLGAESTRPRTDHEVLIAPGRTLVLYTDGLVEHGRTRDRRGDRPARPGSSASSAELGVDELCDQLLDRIVRQRSDDDVAIVVVRSSPEGRAGRERAPSR